MSIALGHYNKAIPMIILIMKSDDQQAKIIYSRLVDSLKI